MYINCILHVLYFCVFVIVVYFVNFVFLYMLYTHPTSVVLTVLDTRGMPLQLYNMCPNTVFSYNLILCCLNETLRRDHQTIPLNATLNRISWRDACKARCLLAITAEQHLRAARCL